MNTSNPQILEVSTVTNNNTAVPLVSESDHPSAFADIFHDSHNIAIWQRLLSVELQSDVEAFASSHKLTPLVINLTPYNCQSELRTSLPKPDNIDNLIADIVSLVDLFCNLFELKQVKLRLTALNRVMCSRFHVDRVPCRLVTTYSGSTTQWLPEQTIDRTKLGKGNSGLPDECSGIYRSAGDIQQLNTGDVALLKGSLWPGNEHTGLVHRSPTPGPGEIRLLLTLDFVS